MIKGKRERGTFPTPFSYGKEAGYVLLGVMSDRLTLHNPINSLASLYRITVSFSKLDLKGGPLR